MSPTNRLLVRVLLVGLPLLGLGGCLLASLASASDSDGPDGDAVPLPTSDYELSERVCFSDEEFGGGGLITNTSDRTRRFLVVVRAEDPTSPDWVDQAEHVTDFLRPDEFEFVVMPAWEWADLDQTTDLQIFDCTWAVYQPGV